MTQTRSGVKVEGDQSHPETANRENGDLKPNTTHSSSKNSHRGQERKRRSTGDDETSQAKKQKTESIPAQDSKETDVKGKSDGRGGKSNKRQAPPAEGTNIQNEVRISHIYENKGFNHGHYEKEQSNKPRLTTPDLEFDYDRSQLRDQRHTPGRERRPRKSEIGMSVADKRELKEKYYIPQPEKPKGRLNSIQEDALYGEESLMNPVSTFHDLHVCHKKGPRGSPTYDDAGFQLDYKKVANWMNPRAYNKSAVVIGMERHLAKGAKEKKAMSNIFFVDRKGPSIDPMKVSAINDVELYMKDHVSKDLGVPWHQIGPTHLKQWKEKGFQPVNGDEWWHEPNDEEKKRMSQMMKGASLRKDL